MVNDIIDLSRLVEIVSEPELFLFFNLFNALFIMNGVHICKNFEDVIFLARLGPIFEKKLLKHSEMSTSQERTFPWLTKVLGIFILFSPFLTHRLLFAKFVYNPVIHILLFIVILFFSSYSYKMGVNYIVFLKVIDCYETGF